MNHEAKIKRIAKQIWDERRMDISVDGDLAWYLDEHAEYEALTEAEYDAIYDELVELYNESK